MVVVVTGGGEADGALDGQVTGHWTLDTAWALGRAEALAESTKVVGLWFLRTNLLQ